MYKMKSELTQKDIAFVNAQQRVAQLKKFYKHLVIYIVVNLFLSTFAIVNHMNNGASLEEAFTSFNNFQVWFYWGIGIGIQAFRVFGISKLFGKGWEERKIKEFMND